jgi:ectoine hydroxylase
MYISTEQWLNYDENGYLLIPGYFSPKEVEVLRGELPTIFGQDDPRRVLENSGIVRSVYEVHTKNTVFGKLVRHPRLLQPAMELLKSSVYVYQSKINAKAAMGGDVWEWHQDFIFWHKEDGLPTDRIVNMSVFLDEVTEFNGPLMFIPGSHRLGMVDTDAPSPLATPRKEESWKTHVAADLKYSLDQKIMKDFVARNGIVAPKGPSGSLLLFNPNTFHGSANNMSPFHRNVLFVTYNSTENLPTPVEEVRPEFLVARNCAPLSALSEDCLLN